MQIVRNASYSHLVRVALVGLVLAPSALFAQATDAAPSQEAPPVHQHGERMDPAQRQARMLDRMTRKLKLTPDQVSQIKTIQADNESQMQAMHSDTSVTGADRHSKMMDLHKSENEKVRAVLNDEQKSKFDAMQSKRQERMHDRDNDQGAPPPPPAQ